MTQSYTPEMCTVRNSQSIKYLAALLSTEADSGSLWWQMLSQEILQSSVITLHSAMGILTDKMAVHEDSALLVNTHLRVMTKALNNKDLALSISYLIETFTEQVLPTCNLTFDFVNKEDGTVVFNAFECVLFYLFFYQDEIIDCLLHYSID